jgi:cation diffusion facilitator family transporter
MKPALVTTSSTAIDAGKVLAVVGVVTREARPNSALPEISLVNWAVMGGTIAVNLFVSAYEAREGRRLQSAFLVADATHTRADLYVSLGVVASFVAALAGLGWADPLVAVLIAAIIAWQALRILLTAFDVLTDRAALPAERLAALAAAVPGVREVCDVRTRGRGDAVYVDLIARLDGGMTLHAAHELADRIEAALQQSHPEIADVVVHLEPDGPEGPSR